MFYWFLAIAIHVNLFLTMTHRLVFGPTTGHTIYRFPLILRWVCSGRVKDNQMNNGYKTNEELAKENLEKSDFHTTLHWEPFTDETLVGVSSIVNDGIDEIDSEAHTSHESDEENDSQQHFSSRRTFFEGITFQADRVIEMLQQDGPGFDVKSALDELQLTVSVYLVREVLVKVLRNINNTNKYECAKLGNRFFVWSSQQSNYRHTSDTYHLVMKIFADCEQYKAMWKLVDEMTKNGYSTTARTFHILICTCRDAGMARKVVEKFIQEQTFNYRPFKHSFNAILHSLLTINQYRLIEWVYQKMLLEHSPDIFTYNILMCAKYRLGKLNEFYRLYGEICSKEIFPDLHTYNIVLHVLGERNEPFKALKLLNGMKEDGCDPSILHFTSLIDGLRRAGNMEACNYFFDEMVKKGLVPDVVCYTVMITGYVVAGELEKAQAMFDDMIIKGQLPNVFTYNSMIQGLCVAGKFNEALAMLKEMEFRGCNPNFVVYSTLLGNLINAGKLYEARELIKQMEETGKYHYLLERYKRTKGYRRCYGG